MFFAVVFEFTFKMLSDWKNWCRLCSSEEPIIKIESTIELLPIIKLFKFTTFIDENSSLLCDNCYQFLIQIKKFSTKCLKVDKMYSDLKMGINRAENDIDNLKFHYGIDVSSQL